METQTATTLTKRDPYWEKRKDSIYLFAAREICKKYSPNPSSVLDVGSNKTPTLEWHRASAGRLVSIDLRRPYVAPGVESITQDFFLYPAAEQFDLVTCFQVLEHIPDPTPFAQRLLELGRVCVVSVPYKWKEGKCKFHIHDPSMQRKCCAGLEESLSFNTWRRNCTRLQGLSKFMPDLSCACSVQLSKEGCNGRFYD